MIVLGIETSCDETAAAVLKENTTLLSSVVASQISLHASYGGVVPELASRKHVEVIGAVVQEALHDAGMEYTDIEGVAVTRGPGLVGSLLVGFSFAKSLAYVLKIPWVGVDHLEGHIFSLFLSDSPPSYPFVVLLASGGHTGIYYVKSLLTYELLGKTRDDAAGEAFDKVAKMLKLGYPGGPVIDRLSEEGDSKRIRFPKALMEEPLLDFSFSGIKTAVARYIQTHPEFMEETVHIAAGFQEAVVEVLTTKLIRAAQRCNCSNMAVVGGVAGNRRLREMLMGRAKENNLFVSIPPMSLCGDNAAMIAYVGGHRLMKGEVSRWDDDVYSRNSRPRSVS
ncbi:MAG: tRNA (adenosine(37)-N6)-threonylcarbamoyltransferase complex transferase subunit TsaD [Thermodesulfobacteriota bacterium]